MPRFRLRAAAKADLKGIARFTEQAWGRAQRNKYLTEFDHAFQLLTDNTDLGKSCDYIRMGYRRFSVGVPISSSTDSPLITLLKLSVCYTNVWMFRFVYFEHNATLQRRPDGGEAAVWPSGASLLARTGSDCVRPAWA